MYKVTEYEFNGYVAMMVNNVPKSTHFHLLMPDFHPILDCSRAEIIVCLEDSAEKFFSHEDNEEDLNKIIEQRTGLYPVPLNAMLYYTTLEIPKEDIEDFTNDLKI